MIKRTAAAVHSAVSPQPVAVALAYISGLSLLCRNVFPRSLGKRVQNSIYSIPSWPDMKLRARTVLFGRRTKLRLIPHIGEYDGEALFQRRITYEAPIAAWLEANAAASYDVIIEIGANIGLYSVFFDALIKRFPHSRLKRVVAFEPSKKAYQRLIENVTVNRATNVQVFNAAVGGESDFRSFFEPDGHLCNGSLNRDFAAIFSQSVSESVIEVVRADQLNRFIGRGERGVR